LGVKSNPENIGDLSWGMKRPRPEALQITNQEPKNVIDKIRTSTRIGAMKTNEQKEPELKRYVGHVSHNGVIVGSEYLDWFTDDEDARATYRVIMEKQGIQSEIGHDRKSVRR